MTLQDDRERVRTSSDIVDLISKYVQLKPSGKNLKGLCPFHNEKSPSFFVDPGRQRYHCFGCQADGDVYEFLMQIEGQTFPEALKQLAEQANIVLSDKPMPKNDEALKKLQKLFQVSTWAAERFRTAYSKAEIGDSARKYLVKRGLPEEVIQAFGLGFSPPGRNNLIKAAERDHYSTESLEKAGLIIKRDESDDYYDRFRNRLMFPIKDAQGRIVAFGGRVLGNTEPKYLNSPETDIFHKSDVLYGMDVAKDPARRKKQMILVEGYMDVLACHSAGFTNSVASLGTAFTEQQAKLLKRYVDRVIILYDTDNAGIKAAIRAFEILNQAELQVRALAFKDVKDPDEFVKKHGAEAFATVLEKPLHFVEYMLEQAKNKYDIASIDGKVSIKNEVVAIIIQLQEAIEREEYTKLLAKELGQPLPIMEEEVAKALRIRLRQPQRRVLTQEKPEEREVEEKEQQVKVKAEERVLLSILLRFPVQIDVWRDKMNLNIFKGPVNKELAGKMLAAEVADPEEEESWFPVFLSTLHSGELKTLATELSEEDRGEEDPEPVIKDCMIRLKRYLLREEEGLLQHQILEAARTGDMETLKHLEQLKFELVTKIQKLKLFW